MALLRRGRGEEEESTIQSRLAVWAALRCLRYPPLPRSAAVVIVVVAPLPPPSWAASALPRCCLLALPPPPPFSLGNAAETLLAGAHGGSCRARGAGKARGRKGEVWRGGAGRAKERKTEKRVEAREERKEGGKLYGSAVLLPPPRAAGLGRSSDGGANGGLRQALLLRHPEPGLRSGRGKSPKWWGEKGIGLPLRKNQARLLRRHCGPVVALSRRRPLERAGSDSKAGTGRCVRHLKPHICRSGRRAKTPRPTDTFPSLQKWRKSGQPKCKNVGFESSGKKQQRENNNPVCLKMTTKRNLFVRLVPCRCLRGEEETVTALDYSHCSLEQVPKEIFTFEKTLEELYLDANQIEELPKQLFNCQSLYKLSLPDNDLTTLPASIANLINLRELDVSKNGIQEFPENIKNCKVLAIVEASVNPISKLPDGFSQLLNLTQLYLNDAFLEFLPANFGRLTKLQILELRENQLKMLPKTMNRLTQLERLDLGSNEFTEVPEVLEQLSGLKEFWMDDNKLTLVPGFMGSLKHLTYLDISKNNIETLEEGVSGCESLQDLLLSSNSLQQLPESIGCLKKLTVLKIDENQLMYLPDSIGGLIAIEELDCSFNEIETLPSSIGQLSNIRTFAADHNFLTQLPPEIGNWKYVTVLFLHSNKLEVLPEEMGDMQKLKVINLSDNRLKYLPYSILQLQHLTALWLSDNQSKPLIPLQKEVDPETQETVVTNYMFPQQPRSEDVMFISDNESFNPSLWEEQRKQRAQVAFECDEDKDEREAPPREGNLKRYPTPYPDELKNMVKTVQTIVHRLKDEENTVETNKEAKQESQQVAVKDIGVKTSEITPVKNKMENEQNIMGNCVQKLNESDDENSIRNSQESEELSSDEEMKVAEMRPPLIETSINQPKVVALGNSKKDDNKAVDSSSDDPTHNSNQNNSNCSSPSRMSDSESLNTDSSQEASLCSPDREITMAVNTKIREEDENSNNPTGKNKVPHDWREQVLRHIEAKKLEKSMLSRSFNSNYAPVSNFYYGSSRDLHGSQGNVALSVADGRSSGVPVLRHPQTSNPVEEDVFISGQQNYSTATLSLKEAVPDTIKKLPVQIPLMNGQMGHSPRPQPNYSQIHHAGPQTSVARHPSREQLIDYLMLKVAHQPPYSQPQGPTRQCHEVSKQEIRVRIEKDPELGFSISGGIGGRGNPFRPDDDGIFVTRVQPEGPASKLLQPGDKIIQANGYSFISIDHGQAVSLLKTFQNTVELTIVRELS
ncbi:protein LAP2 [Crotalus adamanteus]|uniref:Erbin n=1 Tax=Crotalus adamanteus TaxID=8729 RepID=A0AAW1C2U1_CROAD